MDSTDKGTINYPDFLIMMLGGKNSVLRMILLFEEKRKEKPKPTGMLLLGESEHGSTIALYNTLYTCTALRNTFLWIKSDEKTKKTNPTIFLGIRKKQSLADLGIRPDMAQHLG